MWVRLAIVMALGGCSTPPVASAPVDVAPSAPEHDPPEPEPDPPWRVATPELDEEPTIRVLLDKTTELAVVAGDGLRLDGETVDGPLRVQSDGVLSAGDRELGAVARFAASDGVTVGGHGTLPGVVELRAHPGNPRMMLIVELPFERYVAGVVSNEIPGRWDVEVKKAQAIAARSYAMVQLLRRHGPYTVVATQMDQVYRAHTNEGAVDAATATRGQVLVADGALAEAFYHSTCGGETEHPNAVWEHAAPWRWATPCTTCAASPRYAWIAELSPQALATAVTGDDDESAVDSLAAAARSGSGRVQRVTVSIADKPAPVSAVALRRSVGPSLLRSTWFDIEQGDDGFTFRGRGYGHGVGMCQWGAHGMVAAGSDHLAVLSHYYRGTEIRRLYE